MTSLVKATTTAHGALAADRLWRAATVLLALMPFGMAIAHRSSPVFLGLSAVLALAALGFEGRWGLALQNLQARLRSPLGLAVVAFFGWTLVSVLWSGVPAFSLSALGEFWLPIAAAFILAVTLPERMPRAGFRLLAASIAAACLLVLIELHTDLAFRRALGERADAFVFNRTSLTLLVLAVPLLFEARRTEAGVRPWAIQAVVGALVVATIMLSQSGAAKLGLIVVALAYGATRLAPRLTMWAAAATVIALVAAAPLMGRIGDRLISASMHESLAHSHSRERVLIWQSFGAVVADQPFYGAGFNVSPRMPHRPVARRIPPDLQPWLAIGHPHNAALQVWVELGPVGAALGGAVVLLVLLRLRSLPAERLAPRLALFAAVAAVSLIAHGAWQGWWPAAVGAAVVWFRFADRLAEETFHE